jgi:nitrite reductase/ring-hydroxylating ferredoxin subunit/alkylhydroperoxidase/carboxymuconolactone decarboxylase family protein YurZ
MSDALNYLMKVRKDAMRPYFDFLRQGGKHLDQKTRALLSVITKVSGQTDVGFRQYLVRALQAGNTPDEILDALLSSIPMLGLSKIIWAIDIILEMDIPEFRPEVLGMEAKWHELVDIYELQEGISHHDCDGRELFIYRAGDEIRVYDSRCPHQVTNIPLLALQGQELTCPKHHWKFDLASGECIENGARPLHQFASKIENGQVYALW